MDETYFVLAVTTLCVNDNNRESYIALNARRYEKKKRNWL